ncbi:MAG TPA: isoprenylcysteine carboxylmethyltransferase family protein [Myxococcales bacterium]|nr:isoprenylcysteine carboxylmethyltransferase family protein [Myxococcales bacterium]
MLRKAAGRGKAVALPPPFLFGTAIFAGYLVHRTLGWRFAVPRGVAIALGIGLAGVGIPLSAMVAWLFVRARTPISPLSQPTALVLGGPYRFSRNPDYIGQALLSAGIALMLDAPAILLAVLAALLVVRYAVIPREERFLEQRFGDSYREYLRRVPRWL